MTRKSYTSTQSQRHRYVVRFFASTGVSVLALVSAGIGLGVATASEASIGTHSELKPASEINVSIDDADDLLTPADETRLLKETEALLVPGSVTDIEYLLMEDVDDNINDSVEEHLRDKNSPLILEDVFRDGALIFAYGKDPRSNGAYAGEDVATDIDLRNDTRLDNILEAGRPALKDKQLVDGLVASAKYAVDTSTIERDRRQAEEDAKKEKTIGLTVAATTVAVAAGVTTVAVAASRKKKANTAREKLAFVQKHYASVGLRLGEIDVRAHNLNSPFANAELRSQWEQVRDEFLAVNSLVDGMMHINTRIEEMHEKMPEGKKTDAVLRQRAGDINKAHEATERMTNAEKNIDRLWDMEHGDDAVRIEELSELRDDIIKAQSDVKGAEIRERLAQLEASADQLRRDVRSDAFMDNYAQLIHDYALVMDIIREKEFDDLDMKDGERHAPALWDANYRVGSGYNNWVPFMVMSTWHDADVAATTDGGNSTSFSSGFSGAGGGGSF
ncbi:DUF5129 domain-containing protein [Corynebacterium sp. H113]|uniref:DUF5129 domain-containing protein n=1 Tax=Corynebacterium sp. H113 TaxID=3133419 RepID=UPI0030A20738